MSFLLLYGGHGVETSLPVGWNILEYGNAANTLDIDWNVVNDVGQTLDTSWEVQPKTDVSNTLDMSWNALQFIDPQTLDISWKIDQYDNSVYEFQSGKRTKTFIP